MVKNKDFSTILILLLVIIVGFTLFFVYDKTKNLGGTTNIYTTTSTTNNEIPKTTTSSPSTTTPSTTDDKKDSTSLIDIFFPKKEDDILVVQTTPDFNYPIIPKDEEKEESNVGLFNWISTYFDEKEEELIVQKIPGVTLIPIDTTNEDNSVEEVDVGLFDWFSGLFTPELPSEDDLLFENNIYVSPKIEDSSNIQPAFQCFDSDSTKDDAMVKGTCKDSKGTFTDSCSSRGNTLTEYYCRSGSCVSRTVTCGYCSMGACQYPQ